MGTDSQFCVRTTGGFWPVSTGVRHRRKQAAAQCVAQYVLVYLGLPERPEFADSGRSDVSRVSYRQDGKPEGTKRSPCCRTRGGQLWRDLCATYASVGSGNASAVMLTGLLLQPSQAEQTTSSQRRQLQPRTSEQSAGDPASCVTHARHTCAGSWQLMPTWSRVHPEPRTSVHTSQPSDWTHSGTVWQHNDLFDASQIASAAQAQGFGYPDTARSHYRPAGAQVGALRLQLAGLAYPGDVKQSRQHQSMALRLST